MPASIIKSCYHLSSITDITLLLDHDINIDNLSTNELNIALNDATILSITKIQTNNIDIDITKFKNIKILFILDCNNIKSINFDLSNINTLDLCGCNNLEKINNINNIQSLYVRYCNKFNYTKLNLLNLNKLHITDDTSNISLKNNNNLKHLVIRNKNLKYLKVNKNILNNLEILELENCKIHSLPYLPKLQKLKIEYCDNIILKKYTYSNLIELSLTCTYNIIRIPKYHKLQIINLQTNCIY